jgi:hypothetical protein
MNPTEIGIITFAFAFGGVMLGMWLRSALPKHHLDAESKDSVKLGIGLIATMTALILGLVTASAKNSFDLIDGAVKETAVQLLTLDLALARYGAETGQIRTGLKQAVGQRIDMIWPKSSSRPVSLDPTAADMAPRVEAIADAIRSLKPQDDLQRALRTQAVDLAERVLQARWLVLAGAGICALSHRRRPVPGAGVGRAVRRIAPGLTRSAPIRVHAH